MNEVITKNKSNAREVITKDMLKVGYVTDEILDKLEECKSLVEWFDTFKYKSKVAMEQNDIKKWETDYFTLNYIGDGVSQKVDTKRMKETNIYVLNAETGELEEVNAYEYFKTVSFVKAHVTYKEKK